MRNKKITLFSLAASMWTLLLSLPSPAYSAVIELAPGYAASTVGTLEFPSRAFTVDAALNLYTANINDDTSGFVKIARHDAASGYTIVTEYVNYSTSADFVSGIDFNPDRQRFFVSEVNSGGDSGLIRELDAATTSILNTTPLATFRPTGVAIDATGAVYFPGRLSSNASFGNIYRLASVGDPTILISGFVGTGIALDASGNIFASTAGGGVADPFRGKSIYRFDAVTLTPTFIARFDGGVGELTFDAAGNLYAIEEFTTGSTITRISAVPVPSAAWLFGSGLLGLIGIARRKFM